MRVLELVQGTPEWHAHRANVFNASDAPAMLGCSAYCSRSDLLQQRASGITPEVTPAQQRAFDDGHRYEALARPLAEAIVEEDLYPVTATSDCGRFGASYDGLTLLGDVAFEHKSLNATLRDAIPDDGTPAVIPLQYRVQMEHQMMVCPTIERTLFMASKWSETGELIEERHCWYMPDPELRSRIVAGWAQFERDLSSTQPEPAKGEPAPIGRAIEMLPALAVQLEGRVLQTNLPAFRQAAEVVIGSINTDLQTDQDFADAETAVKFCSEAEKRIVAAKDAALAQTASIEELFRTLDAVTEMLRTKRLTLEKLVKTRKEAIRSEIAAGALQAIEAHAEALNKAVGHRWIKAPSPSVLMDAMKGKRTLDTLRAAADAAVANAKVELSLRHDRMLGNHQSIPLEHLALFPDFATVGDKAPEDFEALLMLRVGNFEREAAQRAEAARAEAERAKRAEAERQEKAAVAVAEPVTTPAAPSDAASAIQRIQGAVIAQEKVIRDFIASRKWATEKEAAHVRAVLVEYEKYKAAQA